MWTYCGARADLGRASHDGTTPAQLAAMNGHAEALQLLREAGADLAAADENGVTPALLAAEKGHAGVLRLLQEAGADLAAAKKDGITPAYRAAQFGHVEALRLLLEARADLGRASHDGTTPAQLAAMNGHAEALQLLREAGADLVAADENGWTPALLAAEKGHAGVLRLLQEAGADLAAAKKDGITPAHRAAQFGHLEALRLLLEVCVAEPALGPLPNSDAVALFWKDGRTPAHFAAQFGRLEALRLLLEAGADLQARTQLGDTPLTAAVAEGRVQTVGLLLKARADANALGAFDAENPLDLAERRGNEDLASMLRAAGARPSGKVLRLRGLSALRPRDIPTAARTWFTSGARDLAKDKGKRYHEVLLRGRFANPQVGWLSAHFQEGGYDTIGVGDDADGWAFDGERCLQWQAGRKQKAALAPWRAGDVLGLALDFDSGTMRLSHQGIWHPEDAYQMKFQASGRRLYPAVSMRGFFSMAISKKDWKHSPPTKEYQAWGEGTFDWGVTDN
ncbi:ANK2 [Symbiodinium sp. CCMP2592]|nr:ANK2 [Symbiodinium sp. CCMP2592]